MSCVGGCGTDERGSGAGGGGGGSGELKEVLGQPDRPGEEGEQGGGYLVATEAWRFEAAGEVTARERVALGGFLDLRSRSSPVFASRR